MKLETIINIWHTFNNTIFADKGMPLTIAKHYRTRSTDTWAFWTGESYHWNIIAHEDMPSLIFHEMIHQWQDEYLPGVYLEQNPHDVYFWGWQPTAIALDLKFGERL